MSMAIVSSHATTPTLAVYPEETVQATGTFSSYIMVDDVEAMWGYQLKVVYDTNVLTATSFSSYYPFESPQGVPPGGEINDAEGYVKVVYSMPFGEPYGFYTTTPYPIASIEFSIDASGASPIQIEVSIIADIHGDPIGHVAMCGEFRTAADLPMAKFTYAPESPEEGEEVTFTSESTDPGTSIVAWDWDFGDDTTGSGEEVTHTYTEPGEYTVTLTVTDDDENTDSQSATLTVSEIPPPGADLLKAWAEYRKLNQAARKTCKLFAEVINLDEEEEVLVRIIFFIYDETAHNVGSAEVIGTIGAGETATLEATFDSTIFDIPHAQVDYMFRAECFFNDFDLPNGDHHWAQIEDPTELWFSMIVKDPHKFK
jgi:PKD repeat protein